LGTSPATHSDRRPHDVGGRSIADPLEADTPRGGQRWARARRQGRRVPPLAATRALGPRVFTRLGARREIAATRDIPAPLASGLNNASFQIGGAVGVVRDRSRSWTSSSSVGASGRQKLGEEAPSIGASSWRAALHARPQTRFPTKSGGRHAARSETLVAPLIRGACPPGAELTLAWESSRRAVGMPTDWRFREERTSCAVASVAQGPRRVPRPPVREWRRSRGAAHPGPARALRPARLLGPRRRSGRAWRAARRARPAPARRRRSG
jgi:hypothetical protein